MDPEVVEKAFLDLAAEPRIARLSSLLVKNYRGGYRVLNLLSKSEEPMTPSQLAALCEVSTARMTVILNSLQLKGYLKKHRKRSDRRSLVVSISSKGREVLTENQATLRSCIENFIAELSEKELQTALGICRKITREGKKGE